MIPRVREGVSRTTQEFLELLDERDIRLLPPGQAAMDQWPPLAAMQADDTGVAQGSYEADAEQLPVSPVFPRLRHLAMSPPLTATAFHFQPAPAGLRPRPRPDSPTPRLHMYSPRPPVFTRPQPTQPEAGPSRLPAKAGPLRRVPTPPWLLGRVGPSGIAVPTPSLPARPRAPSPRLERPAMQGPTVEQSLRQQYQYELPLEFSPHLGLQAQPEAGSSRLPPLRLQAGLSGCPREQSQAGPSVPRLDPNDRRFKVPRLPERLSQSKHASFAPLSEEEVAVQQPCSRPSDAEIRATATFAARRSEAGQTGDPADNAEFDDEWEVDESLLNLTYDLVPSSPDCSDNEDGIERGYFTMLKRFVSSDTSESDLESEVDSEDQRLATLEAQAKAQRVPTPTNPDGLQPVKGATGSQARRMVFDARLMAENMQGARVKRKEMAREYDFLEAQQMYLENLKLEMHAKRLVLEETMVTKLKEANQGWLDGSWAPPAKEFKAMKSRAFAEQYQHCMNAVQEDSVDWEDTQEIVVVEEQDEFDRFFEDDKPEGYEPEAPALGPAFEYRPVNARRGSDSSSSLPPSSPPNSEPLLAAMQSSQPEPFTPPRRTPAFNQEGSDSFEELSPKSSGNAARPKFLHPTGAIDRDVRGTQVKSPGQAEVPQAGTVGLYARPPMSGITEPWPYRRTYEEIGSSISHLGRKRRRNEEEVNDDEAGPSARTTTEEWASECEESGMSQPADPQPVQAGYVPRPVVGYTGVTDSVSGSGEPEPYYPFAEEYTRPPAQADWRDLRGGRLALSSPSPPKRARRGYH
ncbi:hypothetical protein DAEQUDRAFT_478646 [Daedalea quercina L-15889]|uniref:Uncharacterized protein n=1 Tax=Daedalea quercina L-15889 TaxID=1314783 RepID=A0A165MWH8_9APHY|nr:hypothetical protein DAEQUDRAFT_478646 [Daedalea quercina L-15889]